MSQVIYGFLAAIVIPIVVFFSAGYFGLIPQIKPLVVQSGSMEPSIKTGSVVFTQKSPEYKKDDVITFSPDNSKNLVTHRIFSFDGTYFQTKGDANEEPDFWKIKPDQIKGKVVLYIPYLGFGVDFVKQPKGFIFLVIIPATIIIYEELKTIRAELSKLFLRLRPVISAGGAPKLMVIFPLFGLGLLLITFTGSFFLDREEAIDNIFAAASSFSSPTPTPSPTPSPSPIPGISDHVVISEVQIDGGIGQANDNDFIELYNPTSSPFNLNGHRLVKRTGNAPNDTNIFTFTSSHIVPAHGYFLWANDDFTTIAVVPDVTSSDTLGASNSVAIRQGDLDTGTIIDALSWDPGASSLKEGTQFPSNPQENESLERKALSTSTQSTMEGGADAGKGNGFDLNDNATDFVLRSASQPQNSGSTTETL